MSERAQRSASVISCAGFAHSLRCTSGVVFSGVVNGAPAGHQVGGEPVGACHDTGTCAANAVSNGWYSAGMLPTRCTCTAPVIAGANGAREMAAATTVGSGTVPGGKCC